MQVENLQQILVQYLDPKEKYNARVEQVVKKPDPSLYSQFLIVNISKIQKIIVEVNQDKQQSKLAQKNEEVSSDSSPQKILHTLHSQRRSFIIKVCKFIKNILIKILLIILFILVITRIDCSTLLREHKANTTAFSNQQINPHIPQSVMSLIRGSSNQEDQLQAAIRVGQAVDSIQNCVNKQQCVFTYRSILRSIECLHHVAQYKYQQIYYYLHKHHLSSTQKIRKFFQMLQYFNGEAYRFNQNRHVGASCQFALKITNTQKSTTSINNSSSILINIQTVAHGPLQLFKNLLSLTSTLNAQNKYNIVNFVVRRKEHHTQLYSKILNSLNQQLKYRNYNANSLAALFVCCLEQFDQNKFQQMSKHKQVIESLHLLFKQTIIEDEIRNKSAYDIERTKDFIIQQIEEGSKVILSAYSESTIITNSIYQSIENKYKENIGIFYVSPLVDKIPDEKGLYLSSPSDLINNKLSDYVKQQKLILQPLKPNIQADESNCLDCNGRYQRIVIQSQKIGDNVANMAQQKVSQPVQSLGRGNITVQLKWDSQPDVDLHIFQPSGKQVFYSNRQGKFGYLDRDDVDGYGPEHYFTSDKLGKGVYVFKLNYYRGSSATKTIVTVSAGSEYFTKQLTLHPALGPDGNIRPPYHICSVIVQQNDQKLLSFKIIP